MCVTKVDRITEMKLFALESCFQNTSQGFSFRACHLYIRSMKCSLDDGKRGFYRAVNSIFRKIGRTASNEVVLQLISTKCMPILLYGREAFSLYNYQLKSLDSVVNRCLMKLFRTSNMQVVSDCQEQFGFVLPNVQLARRAEKVVNKLHVTCSWVYLSLLAAFFVCY